MDQPKLRLMARYLDMKNLILVDRQLATYKLVLDIDKIQETVA